MRYSTVKITALALLAACADHGSAPAPDAAPPEEFELSAPCSYYATLEGTVENHGPVPYLLPAGVAVIVAEPTFTTLGGECDPLPGGQNSRCFRSLRAVTADGERLGVTGRLRPDDTGCVWRDATAE